MEKEKKSNKVLWISATIIALVVIIGALLIMFLPGLKKVPDIQVPDVKNMELQDAIRELEKLGFEVETEEQFHEEIKEGNVIKTNPTIGRTVKKGTVITVTVSKGLEGFLAENYVGKQYDVVEAALTAKGLKVKKETKEFINLKNLKVMSEIAERVKAIIVDKLSVNESEVTPEATFAQDLGADSLDTVELIMEFEKEFGITIPDDQAEGIKTVGDAIAYIENANK